MYPLLLIAWDIIDRLANFSTEKPQLSTDKLLEYRIGAEIGLIVRQKWTEGISELLPCLIFSSFSPYEMFKVLMVKLTSK